MVREYGGCLPEEGFLTEQGINLPENLVQLNSGRAAIYAAAKHSGCQMLYLPHYTCPTILEYLVARQIQVKEYGIRSDYTPDVDALADGELLLWTNYYGCMPAATIDAVCQRYGRQLIIDNSQALFSHPIPAAYNVYSVRKFVGVPCGSWLILPEGEQWNQISWTEMEDLSYDGQFLRVAKEEGSNAAYLLYCENEESFKQSFGLMPREVAAKLRCVDYRTIQLRRQSNFRILHEVLGQNNPLPLIFDGHSAFMYPYFSEKKDLRRLLQEHRVFVPTWWRRVLTLPQSSEFEKKIVQCVVPLPIDQRYSTEDMLKLAEIVKKESR